MTTNSETEALTPDDAAATGAGALNAEQTETIRELCNISFGAAASNLAVILNQDVDVPTPDVTEYAALAAMPEPLAGEPKIAVFLQFTGGMAYAAAFVMKVADAQAIAEMMLGGGVGGDSAPDRLNDLQASAVSEAFSQMMNASATSLTSVLSESVDVSAPDIQPYSTDSLNSGLPGIAGGQFLSIGFNLKVGAGQEIPMVQLMKSSEARTQVDKLMSARPTSPTSSVAETLDISSVESLQEALAGMGMDPAAMGAAPTKPGHSPADRESAPVTVQPVQFAPFDEQPSIYGEYNKNLELVLDVTLNLTVQLGSTELNIKRILELTRGSVIELDRIAGEPVDLYANGKLIAKGEVVVIEDNFGLRITSIVSPQDRLRGLAGT